MPLAPGAANRRSAEHRHRNRHAGTRRRSEEKGTPPHVTRPRQPSERRRWRHLPARCAEEGRRRRRRRAGPAVVARRHRECRPAAPAPTQRTRSRRVTSGNPATVRFWTWYVEQQDQFPQVIADFEEANPNIKVELRLIADVEGAYLPALLAAAAGDDLPEIYAPHVHSVEFGRQGLAADLKADLGADFIAEFFPSMQQHVRPRRRAVRDRLDGPDDGHLLRPRDVRRRRCRRRAGDVGRDDRGGESDQEQRVRESRRHAAGRQRLQRL